VLARRGRTGSRRGAAVGVGVGLEGRCRRQGRSGSRDGYVVVDVLHQGLALPARDVRKGHFFVVAVVATDVHILGHLGDGLGAKMLKGGNELKLHGCLLLLMLLALAQFSSFREFKDEETRFCDDDKEMMKQRHGDDDVTATS